MYVTGGYTRNKPQMELRCTDLSVSCVQQLLQLPTDNGYIDSVEPFPYLHFKVGEQEVEINFKNSEACDKFSSMQTNKQFSKEEVRQYLKDHILRYIVIKGKYGDGEVVSKLVGRGYIVRCRRYFTGKTRKPVTTK